MFYSENKNKSYFSTFGIWETVEVEPTMVSDTNDKKHSCIFMFTK